MRTCVRAILVCRISLAANEAAMRHTASSFLSVAFFNISLALLPFFFSALLFRRLGAEMALRTLVLLWSLPFIEATIRRTASPFFSIAFLSIPFRFVSFSFLFLPRLGLDAEIELRPMTLLWSMLSCIDVTIRLMASSCFLL